MNVSETREVGTSAVAIVKGTPVGDLGLIATPGGLREVRFGTESVVSDAREIGEADAEERGLDLDEEIAARTEAREHLDRAIAELEEYFAGTRGRFRVKADLDGQTEFRRSVLKELRKIPAGAVITYGELAERAGSPKAAQGAGQAVGENPVPIVIPCHRVVRSDHSLGEYGGGTPRKMTLLRHEGVGVTGSRAKDKVRAPVKV